MMTMDNNIYSLYFSPPLGDKFHSRTLISEQLQKKENIDKLEKVIKLCSENDIVVDADLNVSGLNVYEVTQFIEYVRQRPYITEITTLKQYGDNIHEALQDMKLIYSFNNFYSGEELNPYYDTIVLGKNYLREIKKINQLTSNGFDLKLLLNNGCSLQCATCLRGVENCEQTVVKHLETKTINQLYAEQTIFPWELYEMIIRLNDYSKIFFKISNRTSGYEYLRKCLDAYIGLAYVKPYIDENICNYSLFCRMVPMRKRFEGLSYSCIEEEKRQIWAREL